MSTKNGSKFEDDMELRRGPWTLEEDTLLIHYIACHGEGRWNQLAKCSGLKRTGKSCRLRWLNYLKPDVKRGNLTPEEQILILELHSKWGNRWSRIAQHLPGRTDNEIKNYWRTRVQKQARQLKIDANSAVFRDAVRCFWMPRLLEKMASSTTPSPAENLNPNYADLLGHAPQEGLFPHPALFSTELQATFVDSKPCYELSAGLENCSPCVSSETTMGGVIQPADVVQEFSQTAASDAVGRNLLLQQYDALLGGAHQGNSSCGQAGHGVVAPTPASGSAAVGCSVYDYSVLANCGTADNTLDGLWSMDELWHARKLENWGI